ncbi:hypothetical protein HY407_01700 [Candidatus Gottesmanbacteria bacterium]|nr:hypothetical protein [Candidatus Gottesmanbacteria bacterium]
MKDLVKFNVFSFVILIFFSLYASPIFAANVEISNVPSSLEKDQEFEIQVALSGAAANTNNYLRAAFFHDSSPTSYFGYTYNHENNWYNGKPSPIDPHKFLQISISSEGSYSGRLKIKADLEDSAFKGAGTYNLKVGRYTANDKSPEWSTPIALIINAPSPTPTPIPTSPPTATPKPTSTPKPPTSTPILSSPTKTITTAKVLISPSIYAESNILGEDATPTPDMKFLSQQKSDNLAKILIGIGGLMILGAAVWIAVITKRQKTSDLHP